MYGTKGRMQSRMEQLEVTKKMQKSHWSQNHMITTGNRWTAEQASARGQNPAKNKGGRSISNQHHPPIPLKLEEKRQQKKSVCNTKLAESSAGTILLTKPAGLLYRRGAAEKGQEAEVRAGREQVTARNEPEDQLDH